MSLSRRAFVKTLGVSGAGAVSAAIVGRRQVLAPAFWNAFEAPLAAAGGARPIMLHNNENPLGPGEAAMEAMRAALKGGPAAGRYLKNVDELTRALAQAQNIPPDNLLTGCGSTQLLRTAVQVFTSASRPLVIGAPSYEECKDYATLIGTPIRAVPLDAALKLDLVEMAKAAVGAGLVYLNNPNNPTATVHGADAIAELIGRVQKTSPDTTILIDEAYHDYVTDPSYRTQIPVAVNDRRVIVARTFSKAHGMAGLRVGYVISHPDTLKVMRDWEAIDSMNLLGIAAATASISDPVRIERERVRNTEARAFTIKWFERAGFKAADSQANFIFVDIRRPAKGFREACQKQGVLVGRDFPPFERSHVRVSIATMDEMRRAVDVFGRNLGVPATAAA